MKKILFFAGLCVLNYAQLVLQRHFGLRLQAGLSEGSAYFWLLMAVFTLLILAMKPFVIGGYLWAWDRIELGPGEIIQGIKENMRVFGSVLMWGIFFIVPGFIRYVMLYWSLWLVFLDIEYKSGNKDLLQAAVQLFRERPLLTLGYLVLFDVLLVLLIEAFFGIDSHRETVFWDMAWNAFATSFVGLIYLILAERIVRRFLNLPSNLSRV
ncbi:MAG: hypothetical protein NZ480_04220, partial [Bdellovibrionaceae bacterium]|nr:hypothetical protein [Pseudobdellovibrionaceae bacterium]